MNKDNIHTFLLSSNLCILLCLIILSRTSSAAHYQYEACAAPTNCSNGPNISFPFYIKALQQSYCGYPGFELHCEDGFPVLYLSENDEYVVKDIFYHNRSLRVYNAALLASDESSCFPRLTNTTLPTSLFNYFDTTTLHLLSNCKNLSEELSAYDVSCGSNGTLAAVYGGDRNLGSAMETCGENVVAPVERGEGKVLEVLRRGFVLNWRASECSECEGSGGRCGFNETSLHFRCFCPDRPHSRSCKPGTMF